jgi:hypothetical protein
MKVLYLLKMNPIRNNLRSELSDALRSIAAQTEGTYLSLAATYPELLKSMKNSLQDDIGSGMDVGHSRQNAIMQSLQSASSVIAELGQAFNSAHAKDLAVYEILRIHMDKIASLSKYIAGIQENSSAMELISLNAMTVALKAGLSGRAFSFITEEL